MTGMETYQVVLLHLISELLELARKRGNLDWPAIEEEARAIQNLVTRAIAGRPLTAELRENILKRLKERYPGCHEG